MSSHIQNTKEAVNTAMHSVCDEPVCTGCGACMNACPTDCIVMKEDKYGAMHPLIDYSKCIGCSACNKSCPNCVDIKYRYPTKCFAAWETDVDKRLICASGGVGTAISEFMIRFRNGVVVGTAYDDSFTPTTVCVESLDRIDSLKGSKYVQSVVPKDVFRKIKRFLDSGRFVAYIATPCQIAGALAYLGHDYENFLAVDLICHGVCPTAYFKDEVDYLIHLHKLSDLVDIRFRGNDGNKYTERMTFRNKVYGLHNMTNYALSLWRGKKGNIGRELVCSYGVNENLYLAGFLKGVTLRDNCYACKYARPERVSDITIGDFIGLGKMERFKFSTRNVSSVTVNSSKGSRIFSEIVKCSPSLHVVERPYAERLLYRPSLLEPAKRHSLNGKFKRLYAVGGYRYAAKRTLGTVLFFERLKSIHMFVANISRRIILRGVGKIGLVRK